MNLKHWNFLFILALVNLLCMRNLNPNTEEYYLIALMKYLSHSTSSNNENFDTVDNVLDENIETIKFELLGQNGVYYSDNDYISTMEPSVAFLQSEMYISFEEDSKIYLKKYSWEDENWILISNNTLGGRESLNYDENNEAHNPKSIIYNNKLYIVWSEKSSNTNIYQIRLLEINGNSFNFVNNTQGLNFNLENNAYDPDLEVFSENLYIAWTEDENSNLSNTNKTIRIIELDANSNIKFIGNIFIDTFQNNDYITFYPGLSSSGDVLYLSWSQYYHNYENTTRSYVLGWNNSIWLSLFQYPTDGIYIDTNECNSTSKPIVLEDQIYLILEICGKKIYFDKFIGTLDSPEWSFLINNSSKNYFLNIDDTLEIKYTHRPLQVLKGLIYIFWTESDLADLNCIHVARKSKYSDSTIHLNYTDGNQCLTINGKTSFQVIDSTIFNDEIYLSLIDYSDQKKQTIRVAKMKIN